MNIPILALWWLFLGLANGVRAVLAFILTPALKSYHLSMPLPVIGGFYTLLGIASLALSLRLWRRRAQRWAFTAALVYQATTWAVRLLTTRSDYARNLWAWDLLLTAVFLGAMYVLSRRMAQSTGNF